MKIIWALDPFDADSVPLQAMHQFLSALAGPNDQVWVVYVASPGEARLSMAFDVQESKRFTGYPLKLLRQELVQHHVALSEKRVRVLHQPKASIKAAADSLIAFAEQEKADLIAVFSHAKRGIKRWVLGSFAETLVHRSTFDVMVLNPKNQIPPQPETILYATDLSALAERGLKKVLNATQARSPKIVLYHAAGGAPLPTELAPAMMAPRMMDEYERSIIQRTEKVLNELAKLAKRTGQPVEVMWDDKWAPIAVSILKNARQAHADVVAVTAQASPARAMFLGSVSRELLRTSPLPVWVVKT